MPDEQADQCHDEQEHYHPLTRKAPQQHPQQRNDERQLRHCRTQISNSDALYFSCVRPEERDPHSPRQEVQDDDRDVTPYAQEQERPARPPQQGRSIGPLCDGRDQEECPIAPLLFEVFRGDPKMDQGSAQREGSCHVQNRLRPARICRVIHNVCPGHGISFPKRSVSLPLAAILPTPTPIELHLPFRTGPLLYGQGGDIEGIPQGRRVRREAHLIEQGHHVCNLADVR